ncbi:MAG: hypothetical protein ISS48_02465 [Candidatus Aenigmarchaeota archaeon]|nr:hypothetical protein [Candidatus Aenigmarchaeota archaeon]
MSKRVSLTLVQERGYLRMYGPDDSVTVRVHMIHRQCFVVDPYDGDNILITREAYEALIGNERKPRSPGRNGGKYSRCSFPK